MRALLFPGQGTQKVGMGGYLREHFAPVAKPLWQEADRLLGYPLTQACDQGPVDLLRQMPVTQPAVFLCSWTAYSVARSEGMTADVVAGHSLGEYSALAAAGVLPWRDVLSLVHYRGRLMAEVQQQVDGKMAAVLGHTLDEMERLCLAIRRETGQMVEVANHNEERQVVVSGQSVAIDLLVERVLAEEGTRATVLRIGGPAHSSLMEGVATRFAAYLDHLHFRAPDIELLSGSTAQPYTSGDDVRRQLGAQLVHRVVWADVMGSLVQRGVRATWELGPGRVLSGFVERAAPDVERFQANDLPAFVDALERW